MKLKKVLITSITALVCTYGATSQAASTLGECNSVALVNFDGTVVDAALATPELSTLVDAVSAAGLVDTLATAENITVYAPTNAAFDAIPSGITSEILADQDVLTAVLTYHVTPTRTDPRRFATPVQRDTLLGQKVYFSRADREPRVNNAVVNCEGVRTSNGVVWLINSVLIPQF